MRFQSLDPPIAREPRPEVPIHGVTWWMDVAAVRSPSRAPSNIRAAAPGVLAAERKRRAEIF
jgi:hypothetical protein